MTVLTNAKLVDPEAGTLSEGWVRLQDGQVVEMGVAAMGLLAKILKRGREDNR